MGKQITEQFLFEILLPSKFIAKDFLITKLAQKERTSFSSFFFLYTAISRNCCRKNVHATIPKGYMGYVQYTVPETVAVEPTFIAFL